MRFTSRQMLIAVLLLMIAIRLLVITTPPTTQIGNMSEQQWYGNNKHMWVKQCDCTSGVSAAWGDSALQCQNCKKVWQEQVPQK